MKSLIVFSMILYFSLSSNLFGQCDTDCIGTNTFLGTGAGRDNSDGTANTFLGRDAGEKNTSGTSNTYVGSGAGQFGITGGANSFFGRQAGFLNKGSFNSFFGANAGQQNTSGFGNSFFGSAAGSKNTTGSGNSFFGDEAGLLNMEGNGNSFFGEDAGRVNDTGRRNCFFGQEAGNANTFGNDNSFFGQSAGLSNNIGIRNSFFGQDAGSENTSGNENSFFGEDSGVENISGSFNSFFGTVSGYLSKGSGNICLGYGAGPTEANQDADLRLYIDVDTNNINGNDDPLIYGEFDNDFVRINGTFEVTAGLTNPSSRAIKGQFTPVNGDEILEKINQLNIEEWSYNHVPGIRHIGPTAEEFHAAFQLGDGTTTISTIDPDGVALVAIQALSAKVNVLQAENIAMREENRKASVENTELKLLVANLLDRVEKLEHANGGL